MRLEEWQKFIETQFLNDPPDETAKTPEPPAPEAPDTRAQTALPLESPPAAPAAVVSQRVFVKLAPPDAPQPASEPEANAAPVIVPTTPGSLNGLAQPVAPAPTPPTTERSFATTSPSGDALAGTVKPQQEPPRKEAPQTESPQTDPATTFSAQTESAQTDFAPTQPASLPAATPQGKPSAEPITFSKNGTGTPASPVGLGGPSVRPSEKPPRPASSAYGPLPDLETEIPSFENYLPGFLAPQSTPTPPLAGVDRAVSSESISLSEEPASALPAALPEREPAVAGLPEREPAVAGLFDDTEAAAETESRANAAFGAKIYPAAETEVGTASLPPAVLSGSALGQLSGDDFSESDAGEDFPAHDPNADLPIPARDEATLAAIVTAMAATRAPLAAAPARADLDVSRPEEPNAGGEASVRSRARHARNVRPEKAASVLDATELWATVPRHVQTLLALGKLEEQEIAQSSYKRPFQEKRQELIERLLDPILSLEDTARLLNVCPTTVRRYTNKGILTHYRKEPERAAREAASDKETRQRRFRLSDILTFLETQQTALERERGDLRAKSMEPVKPQPGLSQQRPLEAADLSPTELTQ